VAHTTTPGSQTLGLVLVPVFVLGHARFAALSGVALARDNTVVLVDNCVLTSLNIRTSMFGVAFAVSYAPSKP
jgi:hypothetical protein